MRPDAVIKSRFKTAAEGGRQTDVVIRGGPYACVLLIDAEAFDCRLLITDVTLRLGETYELPVKFLDPAFAMSRLSPGKLVRIWEGKEIANGEVVRVG